jgi:hypothetical protein
MFVNGKPFHPCVIFHSSLLGPFLSVVNEVPGMLHLVPRHQHNDTQNNDIQHINIENTALSIMTLSIIVEHCYVSVVYAECHLC